MSAKINDGGPAFPMGYHPDGNSADHFGMTLRDWFAGQALQGWLASFGPDQVHPVATDIENSVAKQAYQMADAMIAAREVKP